MPSRFNGILHRYGAEKLTAFEFKTGDKPKPNTLIFIGGLTDGLGSVTLVDDIVEALEDTEWSVFTVLLSSSYKGFGTSTLDQDVKEIAQCVKYALQYKKETNGGKDGLVSIMGHSTGSQDVLHYIYTADSKAILNRPQVDGAIMQSPVSDREAVLHLANGSSQVQEALEKLIAIAKQGTVTADGHEIILPNDLVDKLDMFPPCTPLTARRFLSLVSPDSPLKPEADDLFSSDLTEERLQETFGVVAERGTLRGSMLILYGGNDEYVPPTVDKEKLVSRWEAIVKKSSPEKEIWDANSGIVPGATHAIDDISLTGPRQDVARRVKSFLAKVAASA
ncbi:hypothetical protein AAP_01363 [Ascosphaera apis ARSEF 7405]|uniref:Esterase n=1 Tax=Ascosphaera apis ARSEF 7405 TaxID=392613 RepID=A0A168BSK6_9EURO|nr:hypothetical protein AAP_01363 [Ascosphaera apis ARSEF 7405]